MRWNRTFGLVRSKSPASESLKKIDSPASHPDQPAIFRESLADAEHLLTYALEMGLDVDDTTKASIFLASAPDAVITVELASQVLTAVAKLSALVKPVTAASLRASVKKDYGTRYVRWALGLAVLIVPFSFATFVTSTLSDQIRQDLTLANQAAGRIESRLRNARSGDSLSLDQLSTADYLDDIYKLTTATRHMDNENQKLNIFVFPGERDQFASIRRDPRALNEIFELELPSGDLSGRSVATGLDRLRVFNDVKDRSERLLDYVTYFYGAVTNSILPILYALLGTCAFLLRSFEQQTRNRTFQPPTATFARFMIAGIAGAVTGLFSSLTFKGSTSIPPLARSQ